MTSSGPAMELTVLLARVALEDERSTAATTPPPTLSRTTPATGQQADDQQHQHAGASLDGFVSWINSQAPTLCHSGSTAHTPTGGGGGSHPGGCGQAGLTRVGSGPISGMHTPPRQQQQSTTTTPYGNTIPAHIASAFAAAPLVTPPSSSASPSVVLGGKHATSSSSASNVAAGGKGFVPPPPLADKDLLFASSPSPAATASSYIVSSGGGSNANNYRSTPQQQSHHRGTPQLDPSAAAYQPSTPPPGATSLLSGGGGGHTAPHHRQLFAPMPQPFPQTPPHQHHYSDGHHYSSATAAAALAMSGNNNCSAVRRTPLQFSTPKHGGSSAGTSPQHGPLSRPMSTLSQPFVLALSAADAANNDSAGISPSPVGFPPQGSLSTTPHQAFHHYNGPVAASNVGAAQLGGIMHPTQHFYGHHHNNSNSTSLSQSPIRHVEVHRGRVVEAAKDQAGCRTLQRLFDTTPFDSPEIQSILAELAPAVTELMADAYGNFLVQKILECAPDAVRLQVTTTVAPALAAIATTPHGTFAVQKLVESLRSEEEAAIVCSGLGQNVPLLLNDVNGGHVVQKVLQCISPTNRQFLFDGISTHVTQVCNHRQGCCVVQKCIDQATQSQFRQVEAAVMHQAIALMSDPYGNYVVSRILDRGAQMLSPQQRVQQLQTIVDVMAASAAAADADNNQQTKGGSLMVRLCRDKFSSNVVEKILKASVGLPPFEALMRLILATEQRPLDILFEGCGNYVIQAALTLSPVPLPRQLLRGSGGGAQQSSTSTTLASGDAATTTNNRFETCLLVTLVEILLPYMASISQQNFGKKVEAAVADALVRLFQSGYTLPSGWVLPQVLQTAMFQHYPQAAGAALFSPQSSSSSPSHQPFGGVSSSCAPSEGHRAVTPVQHGGCTPSAASPGLNARSPEWTPQKAASSATYRRR